MSWSIGLVSGADTAAANRMLRKLRGLWQAPAI
jgi:hypothetical protein